MKVTARAFLDTEFNHPIDCQLLSMGLVTDFDDRELYVELDLASETGQRRIAAASEFVLEGPVLEQWCRVTGSDCSSEEMGRRVGEWLLRLAEQSGGSVGVVVDLDLDFDLMESTIREAGLWARVSQIAVPLNIANVLDSYEAEIAMNCAFEKQAERGLARHHSLADAYALRAAYRAVMSNAATG